MDNELLTEKSSDNSKQLESPGRSPDCLGFRRRVHYRHIVAHDLLILLLAVERAAAVARQPKSRLDEDGVLVFGLGLSNVGWND